MKSKYVGNAGLWVGTIALLLGSASWGQAAAGSSMAADNSKMAATLLRDIASDAAQIRSSAGRLNSLAVSPRANWGDYDQLWNEIQPSVEDMQIKLAHLEGMNAAISDTERKAVDQSKLLIQEIGNRTQAFWTLLDKPGVQTTDERFRSYASDLRSEAAKLDSAARVTS